MRDLKEWSTGEVVTNLILDCVECSRCGGRYLYDRIASQWIPALSPEIRFFENSHGYLCRRCYFAAGVCTSPGCEGIAVVMGAELCRECYIGKQETRAALEEIVWARGTNMFDGQSGYMSWEEQEEEFDGLWPLKPSKKENERK